MFGYLGKLKGYLHSRRERKEKFEQDLSYVMRSPIATTIILTLNEYPKNLDQLSREADISQRHGEMRLNDFLQRGWVKEGAQGTYRLQPYAEKIADTILKVIKRMRTLDRKIIDYPSTVSRLGNNV